MRVPGLFKVSVAVAALTSEAACWTAMLPLSHSLGPDSTSELGAATVSVLRPVASALIPATDTFVSTVGLLLNGWLKVRVGSLPGPGSSAGLKLWLARV